jgi:hypothetical protein
MLLTFRIGNSKNHSKGTIIGLEIQFFTNLHKLQASWSPIPQNYVGRYCGKAERLGGFNDMLLGARFPNSQKIADNNILPVLG